MNDAAAEAPARRGLGTIITTLLIAAVLLANILFAGLAILPAWRAHDTLSAQIATGEQSLGTLAAEQGSAQETLILQQAQWKRQRDTYAGGLLSEADVAHILDWLYRYANATGVEVTNLQLQVPAEAPPADRPYEVRTFQLQVAGEIPQLAGFLVLFKEASVPSVVLTNINLTQGSLTMNMVLYTSVYAQGAALANLPDTVLPTPVPTAAPPSPVPTVASVTAALPAPTDTPTPTITPTDLPTGPVVGPGTYDDDSTAVRYTAGFWETIPSERGYGGSYHFSEDLNAEMQFSFVGTDVALQYVAFLNFGIFELYVDGALWGEVDGYAAEGTFGQMVYISGLPHRIHTITVRSTDRRNEASSGSVIAIDAVQVLEAGTAATPTPQ